MIKSIIIITAIFMTSISFSKEPIKQSILDRLGYKDGPVNMLVKNIVTEKRYNYITRESSNYLDFDGGCKNVKTTKGPNGVKRSESKCVKFGSAPKRTQYLRYITTTVSVGECRPPITDGRILFKRMVSNNSTSCKEYRNDTKLSVCSSKRTDKKITTEEYSPDGNLLSKTVSNVRCR